MSASPLVYGLALSVATLGLAVGCSAKDAAVAPSGVTLTFPSTEAAVASDGVRIQVFDEDGVADLSAACQDLVAEVRSSQSLPTPLVDSSTSACDLAAGKAPFTVGGRRARLPRHHHQQRHGAPRRLHRPSWWKAASSSCPSISSR